MSCPKCGAARKPQARACTNCGHRFESTPAVVAATPAAAASVPSLVSSAAAACVGCRAPLKPGARACTNCGRKVAPVEERREEVPVAIATEKKDDVCAGCSAPLKPGARFCTNCGRKPEAAVARARLEDGSGSPRLRLEKRPLSPGPGAAPPVAIPSSSSTPSSVSSTTTTASAVTIAPIPIKSTVPEKTVIPEKTVPEKAAAPEKPAPAGPVAALSVAEAPLKRKSARKKSSATSASASSSGAKKTGETIKCESCSHVLKDRNVIFCTKCGVQQKGSEGRLANAGQSCAHCSAMLKPGMSFCTKCGTQVGTASAGDGASDDEKSRLMKEKRKNAAKAAEQELEKEKASLLAREREEISKVEAKRKAAAKSSSGGATTTAAPPAKCRKCDANLKPNSGFCTKCGTKTEKSAVNLVSMLSSFNTSTDTLFSVEDLAALKRADDEFAAEIAKIKAESSAQIKAKEQELIRAMIVADEKISEIPDEDFSSQLSDLESKTNEAEAELMEALRAFQDMSGDEEEEQKDSSSPPPQPVSPSPVVSRTPPPGPKVTLHDLDPTKFGLKSFNGLFGDLDEEEPPASPSISLARGIISRGEELRSKSLQEREKRAVEEKEREKTTVLDDLDRELEGLDAALPDEELSDEDFAAVGGKYVRKVRVNSDDDDSD